MWCLIWLISRLVSVIRFVSMRIVVKELVGLKLVVDIWMRYLRLIFEENILVIVVLLMLSGNDM